MRFVNIYDIILQLTPKTCFVNVFYCLNLVGLYRDNTSVCPQTHTVNNVLQKISAEKYIYR